ncbi:MAG TPA: outer membrane beta-barrel protein, partial [Flavisolibacter sp.]|nr:outer membrane beta-barrel protein [Flavisolibacter sp.]
NSIMYAPSVSVQKSKAFYLDTLEQFVMHPSYFYKTGNSRTSNQIENTGYTLVNNLAWRHRFQKAGQSFTATFSNIRSKGQTLTDNIIRSQFYDIQGGLIQSRSSNLKIESLAPTNTVLAGLIYTAPVGWSSNMQIQYNFYNNKTEINKNTFAYQGTSDSSLGIVDSLTNNFNNELFWNRIGLLLRHINNRYQYQLGLGVQQTRVVGKDQVKDMIWKKDFINPVPFALLIYQLNQNKSLQLNYRGQSRQPTALQLQDITDVTNYPFIERGNPNLKQEFIHHLMLIYNSFNVATYNSFFAYLSLDQTNHKISNSITQSSGEQLIVPINVKGAYNINGTISFGLPFQKMQSGSFSTSTQINYGRNFNLLNGIVNSVNTINGSEEVQVAYNFNEHLDMKGQINWMFNSLRIADNQRGINNFWEGEHFLQVNWKTSSGFMFSTTGSYHIFPEGERSYNQGYLIWNISLSKKLLKDRRGTLTFLAHDLLNQNQNIYRRVFNNYIENVQTTTLKRYFLLSFSYRFQKK